MFASTTDIVHGDAPEFVIIGSGPVGLALAFALEDAGRGVVVLESGLAAPDAVGAAMTRGHRVDPVHHAAPEISMCRALGGTSKWWGGRCVPLDPVDFDPRSRVAARWPIEHDELARRYGAAAAFFGVGTDRFTAAGGEIAGGVVRFEDLERWTPEINCSRAHAARLEMSRRIRIVLGATVTAMFYTADGSRVTGLEVAERDGRRQVMACGTVIVACGGLESTRLLMVAERQRPGGRTSPALGATYMGHLSGKIADLVLTDSAEVRLHDFFRADGAFVRRRFTLSRAALVENDLLNIAFWADNPPFHAAAHRSGVLSLVWAALVVPWVGRLLVSEGIRQAHVGPKPYQWLAHIRNVVSSPIGTARDIVSILRDRFLTRPRKPGFLVHNHGGRYSLHFHAEQSPIERSRVRLSETVDAVGMPFLYIDLQFDPRDAEAIVTAHEILDRELRAAGRGRLDFYDRDRAARERRVLAQATDGYHQTGTTRMGDDPADSVVDARCRVHGVDNLYVAASSVFPTSGQANPTFAAVALALRLAADLTGPEATGATATAETAA